MVPQYVVAVGDAFDGMVLIGIFYDVEYAAEYAELHYQNEYWHIIEVVERGDNGESQVS